MKGDSLDIYFTEKMQNWPLDDCAKGFEKCWYWLFSEDATPRFARARNDVPYNIVRQLKDEEKDLVRKKIHERLHHGFFSELYVIILVYWRDKEAIPLLKEQLKNFKIRNKGKNCDFSSWITLCKDAIKRLEKS